MESYRNVVSISLTSYGKSSWFECHSCHRNNPIAQSRWPCKQRRPASIHRDWHYKLRHLLGRDPMRAYFHQFIRGINIVYVFIQNCDPNINLLFITKLVIIGVLIFYEYWSHSSLPILHVPTSGAKCSLIWENFCSGKNLNSDYELLRYFPDIVRILIDLLFFDTFFLDCTHCLALSLVVWSTISYCWIFVYNKFLALSLIGLSFSLFQSSTVTGE